MPVAESVDDHFRLRLIDLLAGVLAAYVGDDLGARCALLSARSYIGEGEREQWLMPATQVIAEQVPPPRVGLQSPGPAPPLCEQLTKSHNCVPARPQSTRRWPKDYAADYTSP